MIQIAICDDDKKEQIDIRDAVQDAAGESGVDCSVQLFSSGEALLKEMQQKSGLFDLVFLDIYMKELSGTDTAAQLKELSPHTSIVFVTISHEHAVEAFGLNALHYLVKPVTKPQIRTALKRYLSQKAGRGTLEVRVGRDCLKLSLELIEFLESFHNGTVIHMQNGSVIHTAAPTRSLIEKLGADFIQLQRGLVVNMTFIERMTSDSCTLQNGSTVLLSRKNRSAIRAAYREFIFNAIEREDPS